MAKKNINTRCPLSTECERKKCEFANHELNCEYYANNGIGDNTIEDQEELRRERDRQADEADYEAELEAESDCACAGCEKADCVCAGGQQSLGRHVCDGNNNCAQTECTYELRHHDTAPADHSPAPGRIEYIPVDLLHPHPDNPRKDVGDISELASSIKANGVLQNLTVVPGYFTSKADYIKMAKAEGVTKAVAEASYDAKDWPQEDGFTVIIGHRRLAAAKAAGLTELPCVVAKLTEKEQISTMLTENMQRNDLTVYEQAEGFQMMLDLGETVESVAEQSGFSETTVRRRVKLLDLDREKFKKAESRGATLQDYMELDKIEDPEEKNKVLDSIGTPNFKMDLKNALSRQESNAYIRGIAETVSQWATEIEKRDYLGETRTPMDYVGAYGTWNKTKPVERPKDADTIRYYYKASVGSYGQVDIYRDHQEHKETPEDIARNLRRAEADKLRERFEELSETCEELHMDFIRNFGAAKKCISTIERFAFKVMVKNQYNRNLDVDAEIIADLLDFDGDEDEISQPEFLNMAASCGKSDEYILLVAVYSSLHEAGKYWRSEWNTQKQVYDIVHQESENSDMLYDFLCSIGYEMSDDEKAIRDGTHELFAAAAES